MIDCATRNEMATAIECYMSEDIDNAALERRLFSRSSDDPACAEIAHAMLYFSSEFSHHYNAGSARLSGQHLASVQRWVAFLRSDVEWPLPQVVSKPLLVRLLHGTASFFQRSTPADCLTNQFWPFTSQQEVDNCMYIARTQERS
jgi:hypothetical protein